jgi:hypothetical protein
MLVSNTEINAGTFRQSTMGGESMRKNARLIGMTARACGMKRRRRARLSVSCSTGANWPRKTGKERKPVM